MMNHSIGVLLLALALSTSLMIAAACSSQGPQLNEASTYSTLQQGFIDPPDNAKVKAYWWWINGSADTTRIREELVAFREAGISAVDIFDIGTPGHSDSQHIVEPGPAFMSDAYLSNIGYAVEVADELDMKVGLNLSSSWNAGGEWIPPEHAAKSLYYSKVAVTGGGDSREIQLPFPLLREDDDAGRRILIDYDDSGRPAYYREVAVIAVPVHDAGVYPGMNEILNLSDHLDSENNLLSFEMPEGEWEVYRYIVANSGRQVVLPSVNSWGPILDHYDADAMAFHINYFIDRLSTVIDDIESSPLSYLYLASYEARGFIWTTTLPEVFQEMHGYDIYKYIPTLHIQDAYVASAYPDDEIASRFLYDFNQTVSDMMIRNHYQKGSEVANTVGLSLISESGGPGLPLHNVPVDALGALGAMDIPRGEFWYDHERWTQEDLRFAKADSIDLLRVVKGPAAAANIYKRPQVEMEAFTNWQHWLTGPFDLKPVGDRAFAEGMNRVTVHGASHNPSGIGYPGIAYHAGQHYNDKLAWWPKIRPFNDYLGRISHMLQEGSFVSDVLYYYGDQAPNIVRAKNQDFSVGPGYDYEVINTEVLLRDLTVEDGLLTLPDVGSYRVMVLDPADQINPHVLEKLSDLAEQGAVILGPKPVAKPGLGFHEWDTEALEEKISETWISHGLRSDPPGRDNAGSHGLASGSLGSDNLSSDNRSSQSGNSQSQSSHSVRASDNANEASAETWSFHAANAPTAEIFTSETSTAEDLTVNSPTADDLSAGKVIEGLTALEALEILQIKPDVEYDGQELDGPLDYIHYHKGDIHYYFLRNTTDDWLSREVRFRQQNRVPEMWDPVTGERFSLPVFRRDDQQIALPLTFKPYDAYFILFRKGDEDAVWSEMVDSEGGVPRFDRTREGYVFREPGTVRFQKGDQRRDDRSDFQFFPVEGSWYLEFPEGWGAPASADFPELISWTESEDEWIRYFSGIAIYHKTFELSFDPDTLSENYRVYLDLGDLEKVGDVWLNGEALGISWTKPHDYDITGSLRPGANDLRIEVANVWGNRVIGDARTGQTFTTTNITQVRGTPWRDVELAPSGLLGPVSIQLRTVVAL